MTKGEFDRYQAMIHMSRDITRAFIYPEPEKDAFIPASGLLPYGVPTKLGTTVESIEFYESADLDKRGTK